MLFFYLRCLCFAPPCSSQSLFSYPSRPPPVKNEGRGLPLLFPAKLFSGCFAECSHAGTIELCLGWRTMGVFQAFVLHTNKYPCFLYLRPLWMHQGECLITALNWHMTAADLLRGLRDDAKTWLRKKFFANMLQKSLKEFSLFLISLPLISLFLLSLSLPLLFYFSLFHIISPLFLTFTLLYSSFFLSLPLSLSSSFSFSLPLSLSSSFSLFLFLSLPLSLSSSFSLPLSLSSSFSLFLLLSPFHFLSPSVFLSFLFLSLSHSFSLFRLSSLLFLSHISSFLLFFLSLLVFLHFSLIFPIFILFLSPLSFSLFLYYFLSVFLFSSSSLPFFLPLLSLSLLFFAFSLSQVIEKNWEFGGRDEKCNRGE